VCSQPSEPGISIQHSTLARQHGRAEPAAERAPRHGLAVARVEAAEARLGLFRATSDAGNGQQFYSIIK
jgi:hypothetical protein